MLRSPWPSRRAWFEPPTSTASREIGSASPVIRTIKGRSERQNATALFERNHLTISESGNPILHCLVTLDESRSPKKAINTWNLDGKDRDQTFPGIYKLDEKAGVLEICIGTKGKRPTTFISEDGSGDIFLKYKRGQ